MTVIDEPEGLPADWPAVAAVVQVARERKMAGTNVSTAPYYLTSYAGTAAEMSAFIRGHWVSQMACIGFWM